MSWTPLLELLAKTSAIAVAAMTLSAVLRFRPARDRVDVLRAGVCLLLLLPIVVLVGPSLPLAWLDAESAPTVVAAPQVWTMDFGPVAKASLTAVAPRPPALATAAIVIYALGVAALLGRFLLGLWTLHGWTSAGTPAQAGDWTATLKRMDPGGAARLVVSDHVRSPLSWGLPPGVILLDADCAARRASAPAVLAHELAHIRRGDWLFLVLSRTAVALFWFNPLVWALHAVLAALTEEAADAEAVAQVDRGAYARALLDLAADRRRPAALAMASSPKTLSRRIAHIMKTPGNKPSRPVAMTLAIGALVAGATPLAALELKPRPPAPPIPMSSAPLPPAPPVASAPPAPPAPLELAAQSSDTRYVITRDGLTRAYTSLDQMDPATRREFEEARAKGEHARAEGERARIEGRRIAREAMAHAAEARRHAAEAVREGARARREGLRAAAEARIDAEAARRDARTALVEARASLRSGADDMLRGAEHMREEGRRLSDPDYRQQVIAENAARGDTVTDAELIELSRKLPQQADDLERQARRLRERASRDF